MGQVEIYQLRGVNHHTSAEAIRAMDTSELKSSIQVQHIVLPPQTGTAVSRQSMLHPSQILKNDPNNAIWRYTKAAFLFFTVILITWIPLSAHRAYSTIHVGVVHVPLQLAIGFLGPLQGFWNTIIYIAISWSHCKTLIRGKGPLGRFWGRKRRTRDNTCPQWNAGEIQSPPVGREPIHPRPRRLPGDEISGLSSTAAVD